MSSPAVRQPQSPTGSLQALSPQKMATSQVININSKLWLFPGHSIPILGLGVFKTPLGIAKETVSHALRVGYRHVDSATMYVNEAETVAGMLHS
jgi:hypothetical protein